MAVRLRRGINDVAPLPLLFRHWMEPEAWVLLFLSLLMTTSSGVRFVTNVKKVS